jgi:3-methyladenine DNA glycosylase AlkC
MANTMAAFKDELGPAAIDQIASAFSKADHAFPAADFARLARAGLEDFELRQRVDHLIACLGQVLPNDFPLALACIEAALPLGNSPAKAAGPPDDLAMPAGLRGFAAWPLIDFIAKYGLNHAEISLQAMPRVTPFFTCEFAVRPFLQHHRDRTLRHMKDWTISADDHVRRLASEGSRPVLPWGMRLPELLADPELARPMLAALRNDPSPYVRRSVANHLNDFSKVQPEWVLALCQKWGGTQLPWMRHALRSLVKQGHPGVWPLLGFDPDAKVELHDLSVQPRSIAMGEAVELRFALRSQAAQAQKLVVDYRLHLVGAGEKRRIKVFKLREFEIAAGARRELRKKHSFKPVTTRRYYPGLHRIEIQVNGRVLDGADFEVFPD